MSLKEEIQSLAHQFATENTKHKVPEKVRDYVLSAIRTAATLGEVQYADPLEKPAPKPYWEVAIPISLLMELVPKELPPGRLISELHQWLGAEGFSFHWRKTSILIGWQD